MDPTAIVELPRTHISCPWRFWDCFLARCGWENLATKRWPWMRNHFSESAWNPSVWRSPQQIKCLGISVPWFFIPSDRLPLPKGDFLLVGLGSVFFYKKYALKNSGWSENLHGGRFHHFIPTKRAHNLHISTPFFSRENVWTHNTLHSGWRRFIINCPNRFVIRSCVDRVLSPSKISSFLKGKQVIAVGN